MCVWYSLAIFCKLKNEGSLEARRLRQILFQIGENVYGDFSYVATGLWRGLSEPHAMSRVVPVFQSGQNVHRRRPQIWTSMDDDHIEKVLAVFRRNRRLTVREVAEVVGICKSSCHLILTDKLKMHRVVANFVPRLLTDAQKENRVTVS